MKTATEGIGLRVKVHILKTYGNQKVAAERWNTSQSYLSSIVTERKAPPKWLLDELGLERRVIYVEKKDSLW